MTRPALPCWILAITSCLGCGDRPAGSPPRPAPPEVHAGSPLVGRWVAADGRKVLEFLPDGTLVELLTLETERTTRKPDGTIEKAPLLVERCSLGTWRRPGEGTLAWDLVQVGGITIRSDAARCQIDESGQTLTLTPVGDSGDDLREILKRRDLDAASELPGLWRRVGNETNDRVDMGVLFTPGGLSIVIGKNSPWDATSSTGTSGWLCYFAHYEVQEGGNLREVRPDLPERPRTRGFRIEGSRLAFVREGFPGRTYERVAGPLPLHGRDLDVQAWDALPVRAAR